MKKKKKLMNNFLRLTSLHSLCNRPGFGVWIEREGRGLFRAHRSGPRGGQDARSAARSLSSIAAGDRSSVAQRRPEVAQPLWG